MSTDQTIRKNYFTRKLISNEKREKTQLFSPDDPPRVSQS